MKLKDFRKKLLKDPEFLKEYFKKDLKFEIARMFIEARIKKGVTQEKLAEMVGTKQPSIARIESGNYLPGLKFLEKVAWALGTDLIPPRFAFLEEHYSESSNMIFKAESFEHPDIVPDIVKEAERLIASQGLSSASASKTLIK